MAPLLGSSFLLDPLACTEGPRRLLLLRSDIKKVFNCVDTTFLVTNPLQDVGGCHGLGAVLQHMQL